MAKSFSPAGMTVKGYFGLGARTFGNPDGALTGGGAYAAGGANPNGPNQGGGGVVVPQFRVVAQAGGAFAVGDEPGNLIIGGTTILGDTMNTASTAIPRSLDSGLTWHRQAVALPTGAQLLQITATDGSGTFVGSSPDVSVTPAVFHILTSTDHGATWVDTSPSATLTGNVFYSALFHRFVVWDGTQASPTDGTYWTSADGVTWTNSGALGIPAVQGTRALDGQAATCAFGLQFQFGGPPQIWRTTNGTVWAPVFTPVDADAEWGNNSFACTDGAGNWWCLFFDSGTHTNRLYRSTNDGATWAEINSANNADLPPFEASVAAYQGALITAVSATTSLGVAKSTTGGVSFGPTAQIAAANTFAVTAVRVSKDGNTLYAWNNAICSTTAFPAFGTALAGDAGFNTFVQDVQVGTGYAVASGHDVANVGTIWRVVP